MIERPKYIVDRDKFPYTYFVSYSWQNGFNSGFASNYIDTARPMTSVSTVKDAVEWLRDNFVKQGSVVILFWKELEPDPEAEEPPAS